MNVTNFMDCSAARFARTREFCFPWAYSPMLNLEPDNATAMTSGLSALSLYFRSPLSFHFLSSFFLFSLFHDCSSNSSHCSMEASISLVVLLDFGLQVPDLILEAFILLLQSRKLKSLLLALLLQYIDVLPDIR